MDADRVVAAMAYGEPNTDWARQVATTLDASFVLVLDEPDRPSLPEYADRMLVSRSRLGFGGARRVSMLLASEFGSDCLVVDGDGQHPPAALERILERLAATDADVVIPQRQNQSLWLDRDGERLDRWPFERLETLCAFAAADIDAEPDSEFDAQPGAFGFRSAVGPSLVPSDDGWLADWEITVRALERGSYETIEITTTPSVQEETTFSWADQRRKLLDIDDRLRETGSNGVRAVFDRHRDEFSPDARETITDAVMSINE
ncbi:glycosyltransferase family protein [Natronorubrum thiooxidans]|uniref:Glycosyl transferase family 2 n=1 Tax=Natronorubrum thiooxidans TaxID=308853 RepID=A0A1N7E2T8_9EURY|nr:glycosyltransferase [Natronorubrum thiooxidans]SIR82285.1 Glycosyl transferase family 2 [Natronorubrum thiooxidans]